MNDTKQKLPFRLQITDNRTGKVIYWLAAAVLNAAVTF